MKKRVLALLCALALIGTSQNLLPVLPVHAADTGTTYYISSIHGNNANGGTTENTAWETLDPLIGLELEPGDQILLERGSVFEDGYIHLQDVHGTQEAPIRISSYGAGARPAIHANGQGIWYQQYGQNLDNANHRRQGYVSSALLLYDVDFVEVSDLELTNESDDFTYFKGAVDSVPEASSASADWRVNKRMDRTGVAGAAKDGGTMQHVYLDNLYIHDIDGNIGDKHMDNGGIQMNAFKPQDEEATGIARYDDIRISNCYVRDVSRAGICVGFTYHHAKFNGAAIADETAKKYGHTNVVFENNYVKDVGNDGIVAMYSFRPLVQNNVADRCGADMDAANGGYSSYYGYVCAGIWPWKCKDGIFQYNEAFDTVDNQDGMPWDIDYSDGTIYQYNYSHNNGGGCIMFCGGEAYNGTFRYNISQNDLKGLLVLSGNPRGEVYNNVFYIDGDRTTQIHNPGFCNGTGVMRNNIFYNISSGKTQQAAMDKTQDTWQNNIFYGYEGLFTMREGNFAADPMFVDPGKAPTGVLLTEGGAMATVHNRSVFDGYKLQANSPAINAGTFVEGSGKYDFFGNEIGSLPDIGAFESDTAETEAALEPKLCGTLPMSIKAGKILDVPQELTVQELKDQFICPKGSVLAVLAADGQLAAEDAVVDQSMKLRLTRGGETIEYAIVFPKEYQEYSPSSMTATAGNEHQGSSTEGSAAFALDNNMSTMWHTNWNGCAQEDVWIELNLGEVKPVAMLKYCARSSGINGVFQEYKVEARSNTEEEWTEVDRGTWKGNAIEYARFDTVEAQYVRLTGLKTASDSAKIFGSAAEIRVGCERDESILEIRAKGDAPFTVTEDAILEVPKNTSVQALKENMLYPKDAVLQILREDGQEAAADEAVKSGMTAKLVRGSEERSYTISVAKSYEYYEPGTMTASAGNEHQGDASEGPASFALDNNMATLWHTNWNGCAQEDVWIELDLGEVKPVAVVKYYSKTSGGANGIFEEYKVEVRSNTEEDWTEVDRGTWSGQKDRIEYARFDSVNARYVRLTGLKTTSMEAGKVYGSAAEIRVGFEEAE